MELDIIQEQVPFTRQINSEGKYWLKVPVRTVAYVTGGCNYSCGHCYASDFHRDHLSVEQYRNVFRKLSDWGVFEVVFLGGEPFVRPDFLDIVEEAVNIQMGTKTSTNASFITKKNVARVKEYFDGKLQVSLDGADEETNDGVRGRGSYKKTLRGIEQLIEEDTHFSMGFVANALNYQNLNDIYRFAQEKKIDGLHIMRGMPKGRALRSWKDFVLSNEQWINTIRTLREIADPNKNPKIQVDGTYEYNNNTEPLGKCISGCEAGRYELTFLPNGDIVPCDMFHNLALGNILDADLSDLWLNNPTLNMFRNAKEFVKGKCGECEVDFCSGCRYQAYILNGGFEESDPFCVRDILMKQNDK